MEEVVYNSLAEWEAEGLRLFGPDRMKWKFKCPSCGYVAAVEDWKNAGGSSGMVAFSCIGRLTGSKKEFGDKTGGPCNYAGGGLFRLNPVKIHYNGNTEEVFAFATDAAGKGEK